MTKVLVQLAAGAFGSAGYAFCFHLRRRYILPAMLGGIIGWGCYLLSSFYFGGIFLPTLRVSSRTSTLKFSRASSRPRRRHFSSRRQFLSSQEVRSTTAWTRLSGMTSRKPLSMEKPRFSMRSESPPAWRLHGRCATFTESSQDCARDIPDILVHAPGSRDTILINSPADCGFLREISF